MNREIQEIYFSFSYEIFSSFQRGTIGGFLAAQGSVKIKYPIKSQRLANTEWYTDAQLLWLRDERKLLGNLGLLVPLTIYGTSATF